MEKIIGKFQIITGNDIFFGDDIKIINKWNETNKYFDVWGWIDKNNQLHLFKPKLSNNNTMYLSNKIYWKLQTIRYNDKRVNYFFNNDCIGEIQQCFVDEYGDLNQYEYYQLYYSKNDLY